MTPPSTHLPCAECGRPARTGSGDGPCARCTLALARAIADETDAARAGVEQRQGTPGAFGPYEILELAGHGGMGSVWTARHRELQRVVAVKLMHPWVRGDERDRKRFMAEARAAARLQHAGIVAVHEVGEHEGRQFLAMEYVEGSSLAHVIAAGPLPPERAARYVEQAAEAMHYAHERGVLHRDLKPHNILIDGHDRPRVTDFGLAVHEDVASVASASEGVIGTPSFMPPEQAAGRREQLDRRSDVYSLGATLYACLTGRAPFFSDTPLETLRQVLEEDPAPPRLLNRHVPRDLELVCLKCLAKDPRDRYASARELAEDLGRFRRREAILARPPGSARRLWLFVRRHPGASGLLAMTAMLLGLMAAAGWLFRRDVLDGNVQSARLAARTILAELDVLGRQVERWALDPALIAALPHGEPVQRALLRRAFEDPGPGTGARLRMRSWLLLDAHGRALANWPPREPRLNDRSFRDYYRGAIAAARASERANVADEVYFSRAFRSLIDGYYNFGISRVVRGSDGRIAALVVGLVGPSSSEDVHGLTTPDRKTALAARCDDPPPRSISALRIPDHVIMLHPAFRGQSQGIAIGHPNVVALLAGRAGERFERDSRYRDPVQELDGRYRGDWLAGFARVSGKPFVVVFQTRDWVGEALRLGGILVLALLAAWLLAPIARRWRENRR